MTIGTGERHAYIMIVLFLAGMAAGGVAVRDLMNADGYYLSSRLELLLAAQPVFPFNMTF